MNINDAIKQQQELIKEEAEHLALCSVEETKAISMYSVTLNSLLYVLDKMVQAKWAGKTIW